MLEMEKVNKMKKYKTLYETLLEKLAATSTQPTTSKNKRAPSVTPIIVSKDTNTTHKRRSTEKKVKINTKMNEYISPVHVKELNKYQLFLRSESAKPKYHNKSPKSRMRAIADAWNDRK